MNLTRLHLFSTKNQTALKHTGLKVFAIVFALLFSTQLFAQKNPANKINNSAIQRCGTMEAIQRQYDTDPAFRALQDQRAREMQDALNRPNSGGNQQRPTTLTGPVTIPVVVHIVIPNPYQITDDAVDYFIRRLNFDYAGTNADSANGAPFYPVRGHSLIRFTLAKRDVAGNFTTGIERLSGTTAIGGGEPQAVKNPATTTGGLAGWDHTKYYNIWVAEGGGLLGISPGIGVGTATTDGVCVNYLAFSNGCFSDPAFNLGRTAVHEIGHNFGLFHTFSGACAGTDFGQLTTAACTLPPTLLTPADDTPPQSGATGGCPTVGTANGCTPSVPKMFQSYMDYTDDACYSMFSKGEVARMEWVLENCRAGYLTTLGGQYPAGMPALELSAIGVVSPGGSDFIDATCSSVSYGIPSCAGPFTPRIRVTNLGTTTTTSLTVTSTINGGTPVVQTVNGLSIPVGKTQTITLNTLNAVTGANNLSMTISAPNGGADANTANNTVSTSFNVAASGALPYSQDFTGAAFPPAGLRVVNPDGSLTWESNASGNGNPGSAYVNCWNYASQGTIDDLVLNPLQTAAGDSVILNFDVSHRPFPNANFLDTLTVLVSTDCGNTFVPTGYKKWGNTLATVTPGVNAEYTNPTVWRTERIGFLSATAGNIIVAFRLSNRYGNNVYLDNINIYKKADVDLRASAIVSPTGSLCNNNVTPSFRVQNIGIVAANSYDVTYTLDGVAGPIQNVVAPLAPNATATLTFPAINITSGSHRFQYKVIYNGDLVPGNDTIGNTVTVRTFYSVPLAEGFEGVAFPPTDWTIVNPDNGVTWARNNNGNNSARSIRIDNYNSDFTGQTDDFVSPPIDVPTGADSIIISFDVAHKNFTGSNDVLSVGYSTNCGVTYSPTGYSKSGATLATAGASTAAYNAPVQADWRRERIALPASIIPAGAKPLIRFRNLSDYGNMIYIDNINIETRFKRDVKLISVGSTPGQADLLVPAVQCSNSIEPTVIVRNIGIEAVTGFTVNYRIGTGIPFTKTFVQAIAPNAQATVTLPVSSLTPGYYNLTVYSVAPLLTTTGGTGDLYPANDTLRQSFSIVGTQPSLPLTEGFESTTFPPVNWGLNNPDVSTTWGRTTTTAKTGIGSMVIKGFTYTTANAIDQLISPVITNSTMNDSIFAAFDYSYRQGFKYPGSTVSGLDTLEIQLSKDCGNTLTTVWKKWGADLQTVLSPNYSDTVEFKPTMANEWKHARIDITSAAGTDDFQLYFVAKTNKQNNLFVDNINISAKTLPARLKAQGYLAYPNPFSNTFTIHHLAAPTDLLAAQVFNSVGELVWDKRFVGNAATQIKVDLSNLATGVYVLKMFYANKTIVERIVKR